MTLKSKPRYGFGLYELKKTIWKKISEKLNISNIFMVYILSNETGGCFSAKVKSIVDTSKAQAYEKKITILFFVCFGTHNNKFHTIYKQTSVFVSIFPCCFSFISKAATTKNRHFMLGLGLGYIIDKNFKSFFVISMRFLLIWGWKNDEIRPLYIYK
jgi:hypothetical protein